jgi:hypothetical protein
MTSLAPREDSSVAEISGVGIRVDGALVAWFAASEDAENWARANHFGNWLAHPCTMPNRPPFTPEQIAEAEREGALLWAKLQPGRLADD